MPQKKNKSPADKFNPAAQHAVEQFLYRQAECLELLQRAGFGAVKLERYKISWLWGLMTAVVSL